MHLTQLLGRFHLLLLHLPIGLLLFAGLLAFLTRRQRRPEWRPAAKLAIACGALAASLSAICGWLLSQQGGYEDVLLQKHQWFGLATAALALLAWWGFESKWQLPLLGVCCVTLMATGHFGGSLTHGENYLFKPFSPAPAINRLPSTVYQDFIQPILEKKCLSCHNSRKKKGELLLDTPEHILQGGKDGPVLVAGKPGESPLLQRPLLPMHHDDHMPPAGKPQLTPDELILLRWWVEQGADFQKKLEDLSVTPEVARILKGQEAADQNPVFALSIKHADPADLALLRAKGISVMPLGAEKPWLSVSLAGNRKLNGQILQDLQAVAAQIAQLDFSNTNLDDAMLRGIKDFPHLTRLNLFQTAVTDAGMDALKDLQYLDYLNLAGTKVGDAGLTQLAGLKNLRNLYGWRSGMTQSGLAGLKAQMPELRADLGSVSDTASSPLPLRPPQILFSRNIFEDTVQVLLEYPKLVDVYYTIDEASPTTQSIHYQREVLVFNQSTRIRAIAAKPGWASSPVMEASFVKRKYRIKNATLLQPPSPSYPGAGAASLGDGKIADNHIDKAFLGYEGEHLTAILDLGETIDFTRLSVHCIENNNSWIFSPRGLQVWTSGDGKKWTPGIDRQYPVNTSMQPTQTHLLSEAAPKPLRCRYLKVRVESLLKNPAWHPGAGKKCWVFVDEMLVE